jgi:nucleoside-diphosphate-sugar epimerase
VDEAAALKVAVTGAGGFVGATLCPALAAAGHRAAPLPLRGIREVRLGARTEAVIHLAALAHRRHGLEELNRVNVELAEQVGQAAAAAGARMIFVSTVKVHGEQSIAPFTEVSVIAPQDPYAESKARAEDRLRRIAGLRLTVLRPPLMYGPGVKANFRALMRAVARGLPLPFAAVDNRRSLLYVGNFADAVNRCLSAAMEATYLLADGAPVSTPELCRRIGVALGRPARLFPFPVAWLPSRLTASLEIDDGAIRRELGWRPPFSLDAGLESSR